MATLTRRRSARIAGALAGAALIVGGTTGVSNAATTPTGGTAFDAVANYGVVTTTHPDAVGCNGYKVVGSGTVTGNRITGGGTWSQTEDACTATVPGQWDINGKVTITEADGDHLYFTYHLSAPLTSDTMVYPTGKFTITGGDGSFDEAVGGGTMNATVNLLDKAHVTASLSGTMGFRWQI
ncbi:hypothetical protein GCM10010275_70220 [Streptomyces litmocidini]|uniref:hypothetical protein n=1 Tax=Streptomyces litmocidini TaxID=67318 RepID=UPI00167D5CDD|nr:hypothetical protein [Streptomyces litmocidini]GGV18544.1 hypothetical protein GCM10010275_70220 [Streptomyces litmocidini]